MTAVIERAPAKINLFLHVGPLRADGYHDLASLIAFAAAGDVIEVRPSAAIALAVEGPFAHALAPFPIETNLVLRAAKLLQRETGTTGGASICLRKNLPVAAGVGGGSADAAAALRALVRLWKVDISHAALARIGFRLGADVPVCLAAHPARVTGAGENVARGPALPPLWAALVNPRVETPTGPVFRAFDAANPAPRAPRDPAPSRLSGYDAVRMLIADSCNDLEAPAVARAPAIGETLAHLRAAPGVIAARMSGSGATCFALFASQAAASRAAAAARGRGWWADAGALLA